MKVCPECDGEFDDGAEFCPNDGARLRAEQEDEEESDPLVGRLLDGRWRIKEKFGEGGMGSIYLASQKSVQRQVAIKTLRASLSSNEEFTERFLREARVTSTINHPHCVTIHDFGQTEDGTLYLVMEMLEGEPLAERMEGSPVELLETLTIGKQIASALSAAHDRDIVHRDLKPDNIFLLDISDGSTFCKVLDFGISKDLSEEKNLTKTGELFGTPRYMSPEQSEGGDLDGRTDIYSLGCILYEMLTGRPPFAGDTAMSILVAHVQEEVPPLSESASRPIPPEVDSFVMRLLEKEPENRPESAADVGHELEELLSTLSVEGRTRGASLDSMPESGTGAAPADGAGASDSEISRADTLGPGETGEAAQGTGAPQGTGPQQQSGSNGHTGSGPITSSVEQNRSLLVWVVVLLSLGFLGLTGIGGYYVYASYSSDAEASNPLAQWFGAPSDEPSSSGGGAAGGDSSDGSGGSVMESISGLTAGGGSNERDDDGDGADREADREGPAGETEDERGSESGGTQSDGADNDNVETASGSGESDSDGGQGSGTSERDESGGRPDESGSERDTDDKSVTEKIQEMAADSEESSGRRDDQQGDESDDSDDEPSESTSETTASAEADDADDEPEIRPGTFVDQTRLSATGRSCNKADIRRTLAGAEPQLGRCYHDQVKSNTDLAGDMMLDWNISTEGQAIDPSVLKGSLGDQSVQDCVVRTIENLSFAPPSGGRCYTRATFDFHN